LKICLVCCILILNKYRKLEKKKINLERKLKVGVIGLDHHKNIRNNILKFAMSVQLKELGVDPYIIGYNSGKGIKFIAEKTNLVSIKGFRQLNQTDYDILMVNSDQTWRFWNGRFDNIAFLKFAENWTIPKFIYGASIGTDRWPFSNKTNNVAKKLLKNFTGISVREMGTIKYVKQYLNMNAIYVLDPTILIDKAYYLDAIKDYKKVINKTDYILTYKLDYIYNMEKFINITKKELKYYIYDIQLNDEEYIEKFLSGIYNCKAVITNSYHGVLFSTIFNKPFVVFTNINRGNERFNTTKEVYGTKDRFFDMYKNPSLDLLLTPLRYNYIIINYYRNISIQYLKKNLNIL
jgi:hypothetical protein